MNSIFALIRNATPKPLLNALRNTKLKSIYTNFIEKPNIVYAQNHIIEIYENPEKSHLKKDKIYEIENTLFFREFIKEGDTVYDVGANIGYFTLEFARLVGPNGKVLSFEPHPQVFQVLKRNINRNGYQNVKPYNCACGDMDGTINLFISNVNEGNHKIVANDYNKGSTEVDIVKLSKHIKENLPKIIKMDIEGAELLAIKGIGHDILKNNQIDFVLEYHPYEMNFFDIKDSDLFEYLEDLGYYFYNLATRDRPSITSVEVMEQYRKEDFGMTNLYCTKNER